MQPHLPPTRIQQAARAEVFIDDHAHALEIVTVLAAASVPPAARKALQRAAAFLGPHMDEEEAVDGVFQWINALEPGLAVELERLRTEHREIRSLLALARTAPESDLVGLAQDLAERLEAHEAAERTALERAMH